MNPDYLEFEQPIAELEYKLAELRQFSSQTEVDLGDEITRLQNKTKTLTESIFAGLNDWQIAQLARHPQRPYTLDYIKEAFTDYRELHGDRHYGDDHAIVGGLARLNGRAVMIIGHEKGRDTKEKVRRNFGMPRPEGYRKALRLMKLAERFGLPLITFIDTPGAYPGIGAEERGQSEAIARNLYEMAKLDIPTIAVVIGEGGSGGALAIGVADRVLMLQYGMYSVISPEGCASILLRDSSRAKDAAAMLKITSREVLSLKLINGVIEEPLDGAHTDPQKAADKIRTQILHDLADLCKRDPKVLVRYRRKKIHAIGLYSE